MADAARAEIINGSGTIRLDNVWTRFGGEESWIHRGLSFDVRVGESFVIIGGSGAGKSVLVKLLIGLLAPERGNVIVDGIDIPHATKGDLYRTMKHIGVLFQFGALFDSLTIWENVTFGLQDRGLSDRELRRIATEKLKMVGLRGVEDRLPSQLSGGMRKRVGLARAIAYEPDILICDEPTSGLDPVMSDTISELILQMRQRLSVTTLTITHDMKSAYKIADRIAMLYDGRILATETPQGIQESQNPIVQQFVQGRALLPMGGSVRAEP